MKLMSRFISVTIRRWPVAQRAVWTVTTRCGLHRGEREREREREDVGNLLEMGRDGSLEPSSNSPGEFLNPTDWKLFDSL